MIALDISEALIHTGASLLRAFGAGAGLDAEQIHAGSEAFVASMREHAAALTTTAQGEVVQADDLDDEIQAVASIYTFGSLGDRDKAVACMNYIARNHRLAHTAGEREQIVALRAALQAIVLEAHETIPPDGKAAAFGALDQIASIAHRALTTDAPGEGK